MRAVQPYKFEKKFILSDEAYFGAGQDYFGAVQDDRTWAQFQPNNIFEKF